MMREIFFPRKVLLAYHSQKVDLEAGNLLVLHSLRVACFLSCLFCLICFFTSHKHSFSYVGTGLPGLKQ